MTSDLSNNIPQGIKFITKPNCVEYDMYISSEFRISTYIDLNNEKTAGPAYSPMPVNLIKLLREVNNESYQQLIISIKKAGGNEMIFLGISNSCGVFIKNGFDILKLANHYIKSNNKEAKIYRIILTDELKEKEPVEVHPTSISRRLKYKLNTKLPKSLYKVVKEEKEEHLCVYYPDAPDTHYK
tara:strand:- start:1184 stop:1735 length:552 start_codon:yes stop_codon:yes gene_type:complete